MKKEERNEDNSGQIGGLKGNPKGSDNSLAKKVTIGIGVVVVVVILLLL